MNDALAKWILPIAGSLMLAFLAWAYGRADLRADLGNRISVLETKADLNEKVIPGPVERSQDELRTKTNGLAENLGKMQGSVSNNSTEISNLKEQRVARLENR
jgi:hypothetical protein